MKNRISECVLVTGGAGFIGSHIVDRLLTQGNKVVVLDDLSSGKRKNINSSAIFYDANIADQKLVETIFGKHDIDYVIHQAAKINLNVMLEDPIKDVKSSVFGTLNLLRCSVRSGVKKFIYASSVAVYGRPRTLPVSESGALDPVYSYGIAKKCAEEYVRYYSKYYGLRYSILRYANVYGPRQPIYGEVGVIAIFTDRVVRKKPLVIYGDGNHERDYIYIDDVVDATLQMMRRGNNQTYNVGCGRGVPVNEVFKYFCEAAERKIARKHKPERVGELGRFYCDVHKIRMDTGFLPKTDIRTGIKRTLSYYVDNQRKTGYDDVSIRAITMDDKTAVFKWRNTPFLIELGSSGRGVTWKEHSRWFEKILGSKNNKLFIVHFRSMPVGQVRFELAKNDTYVVSIYLLKQHINKGIGTVALKKGLELIQGTDAKKRFIAFIKKDNEISRHFFSKVGFRKYESCAETPAGHVAMKYC